MTSTTGTLYLLVQLSYLIFGTYSLIQPVRFFRQFISAHAYRAMNRDPNIYESPNSYNPERFLHPFDHCSQEKPGFRSTRAFGFGRRICPGKHLAESMVFIHAACILAAFDISKPKDSCGNVIEQTTEFVDGLITYVLSRNLVYHTSSALQ